MNSRVKWLRIAYLVGIITDALALIPMLCSPVAKLVWGFDELNGGYLFAMGCGSSLMAGWTVLLIWAYKEPLERRFIALLTILVVVGFFAAEVLAAANGAIDTSKLVPTWIIQAVIIGLFGFSYVGSHRIANEK